MRLSEQEFFKPFPHTRPRIRYTRIYIYTSKKISVYVVIFACDLTSFICFTNNTLRSSNKLKFHNCVYVIVDSLTIMLMLSCSFLEIFKRRIYYLTLCTRFQKLLI